jgi:LuxR family transcriptional regulator
MGISPAMVEKHLRLAREVLDVETTAHAVAKAALFNHLFAGEPAVRAVLGQAAGGGRSS